MIRLLLAVLGPRFFNAKSKRILIIGSFYSLITDKDVEVQDKAVTINQELNLATDHKGVLLGAILPEILWDREQCDRLRKLPTERLIHYYETMIPKWLKEDVEDCSFNLRTELQKVASIQSAAV